MKHADQQRIWDAEHARPTVLMPMDEERPSGAVDQFYQYLESLDDSQEYQDGFEIGCGKGRNVNWLAAQGLQVTGLDFSPAAINEAKRRASAQGITTANFLLHDVVDPLPFANASQDFAMDCYASTDIEDPVGRRTARDEIVRVLRKKGLYLVCLMAETSEFHQMMVQKHPGEESGSFHHPENGKFEKTFTDDEVDREFIGNQFEVLLREHYKRETRFADDTYQTDQHVLILRKK